MIICWDNLEKFNIRLTNRGNFRGSDGTYYYYDSCLECGEPYLSKSKGAAQFCSYECMTKSQIYREKIGSEKVLVNESTDIILSKDEILELQTKYPKRYIKIIKNKYPRTVAEIEKYCIDIEPKIINFSQKLYHYYDNIKKFPVCKICGKTIIKFNVIINHYGYNDVCSAGCKQKTDEMIIKKKQVKRTKKYTIKKILLGGLYHLLSYEEIRTRLLNFFENRYSDPQNLERQMFYSDIDLLWNIYNFSYGKTLYEKIFIIRNNLNGIPYCSVCGKNHLMFINLENGYSKICNSSKCKKTHREKINFENYSFTKLTRNEIKDFLGENLKSFNKLTKNEIPLLKRFKNLYNNILEETTYLPADTKISERIYHIINDLYSLPVCKSCGKSIDQKFLTFERGYNDLCISCNKIEVGKINGVRLSESLREKNYDTYLQDTIEEGEYEILTPKEDFVKDGKMEILHKKCGHVFTRDVAYMNGCPFCFVKHKSQNDLAKWLKKNINMMIEVDKRKYLDNRFEIDIFIPEKNLGIEYDDITTHSEIRGCKDKKYHINKTELSEEKGIHLIHILSYEWLSKRRIMKSALLSKLGIFKHKIFARKCIIRELTSKESKVFLESNHLQGYCNSSIRYGLFYNGELVACMIFGKRRITGKTELELLRFCNKINTQVIGGASKLFKHFVRNNEFEEIVSYADRRWSNGNMYDNLGFELSHKSAPSYWYIENGKLIHRSVFMKHKLPKLLKEFNPELTEWENMQLNGYDRIWDCGCLVYKFKKIIPRS